VYFEYICLKFAGRLLDRVNTPLLTYEKKYDTLLQVISTVRDVCF